MNGERFEQITVRVEGGVATVTLNRPDRYNALCSLIVDELGDVLEEVEGSVEVKVLIRQSSRDYATRRQPSARPSLPRTTRSGSPPSPTERSHAFRR